MPDEPRKFKYYTTFASASPIRCASDKEKNPFLAKASIEDLRTLLPNVSEDSDLLPIAANACVANLGNLRGDVIDTKTALAMYQKFEDKFINVEHDRKIIVGCIKKAALSKFNANYSTGVGSEIIQPDGVKEGEPFNISVAGYIWKVAAPGVAKTITEANDPLNPKFLTMAMSWEVGFDDYKIMVGNETMASSKVVESGDQSFAALDLHLKANGGTGVLPDGRQVFRVLWGAEVTDVVPLGVGLTFNPAGAVAGIVTSEAKASVEEEKTPAVAVAEENDTKEQKTAEIISQTAAAHVTNNTNMKPLASFKDVLALDDANKSEVSIANIANIINAEAEKALTEYSKNLKTEQEAKASVEAKLQDALAAATASKTEIEKLNTKITELQQQQAVATAQSKFNERMAGFDETHVLTPEVRQVVASSINGLTDDAFTTFRKNFDVLYAAKSKTAIAAAEAAAQVKPADGKAVAQEALASATASTATPPNTVTEQPTLAQKLKDAFKLGVGVTVTA